MECKDKPTRKPVDLYKLKSLTNLIVYGYIRPIEVNLSLSTKIIPLSIVQMILRYACFQTAKIQLFAIIATKNKPKHKHSMAPATYRKTLVYMDPLNQKTVTLKGMHIPNDHINMCFMNNIQLSTNAMQYFTKCDVPLPAMKQRYSAIISLSGAGAVPDISFLKDPDILENNTGNTIQMFPNALPPLGGTAPHNITYSNYYGLISDVNTTLRTLQFDSEDTTFEWQNICQMNKCAKRLYLIRSFASVDDKVLCCNYNKERSWYYNGDLYEQENHIYSLKDGSCHSISNLSNGFVREHFGIYYDITTEALYLFGGDQGCSRMVNCYDFHKNVWISTATMQFEHPYYPYAWMDGFVMYIAGGMKDTIGTVECYDTRY